MEFILIEQDSNEWNYIWEWLAKHPINEGIDEPSVALNNGESWQYMGSYKQDERVVHSLRHRCQPRTQTRMDLSLVASDGFKPDEIKKSYKI
jgi:hypothetical protein